MLGGELQCETGPASSTSGIVTYVVWTFGLRKEPRPMLDLRPYDSSVLPASFQTLKFNL